MIKTKFGVSAVALVTLVVACNGSAPEKTSVSDGPPAKSAATQSGPMVIGQATTLQGTTNVTTAARILFLSSYVPAADDPSDNFQKRLPEIAAHTRFLGADGSTTAATTEYDGRKDTTGPEGVIVRPITELKPDAWYEIVVTEDDSLQVRNDPLHSPKSPVHGEWRSHFFTGSAPRIVGAERTVGAKPATYVHVTFSEPVDVSTLTTAQLVQFGGSSIGACIQFNGSCTLPVGKLMLEQVDVVVKQALPDSVTSPLVLALPGGAMGSGRTVAQGAGMTGDALKTVGGVQTVARNIAADDWTSCQDGAAMCWREQAAPTSFR